jgi:hypothetical protein
VSACCDNQLVNREERIEKARQMAAERAPHREVEVQKRANRLQQRLADVGAAQAQRHVTAAEQSGNAVYLEPVKTPREWANAVELARLVTITRAKRRDRITYGEIKWAIFDGLRMLVGHSMFATLMEAVNHESDGVLLSSIIVHQDDGKPGEGFLPYAKGLGFDLPLETLQRQVWEHFG